jgi:hypothetical protein
MKRHFLKFSANIFLLLTIFLWGNFSGAAVPWEYFTTPEKEQPVETPAGKIVADKDSYDGKEVLVSGKISNLKFKTARGGKNYTTFVLVGESGGRINVITSEQPKLKPGQKVKVTGVYRKTKRVGTSTFRNEIEATEIANP